MEKRLYNRPKPDTAKILRSEMLTNVFNDTLKYCKENKKTNVKTKKILVWEEMLSQPVKSTVITVENRDCVEVAQELALKGRTCMLNMANAINRGGGVQRGAMAQEEDLCRRSNLWYGIRPSYYPLGDLGFVYSKNVKFFKNKFYLYMPEFKCDVITIAAPNVRDLEELPSDYEENIKIKLGQMLYYPAKFGVKNLVLSAFGCGAFRNNPVTVSNFFKNHLHNLPYDNIVFAILDDKNAVANGISNYESFKHLENV